ncbi:MAG: MFS transporter [Eubacteriaceae bacterium]|jgi:EmrB/QacA subfamily drug resistance transporter|nr:MFS transporter [Eubacteriaceae bacterium]
MGERLNKKYTKKEATILRICVITAVVTTFSGSSLNIAVPFIEKSFHMGATSVGWVITTYMLVTSALSVPMGKFSAKIGMKKGLIIGIGIFGTMTFAATFAVSGPMIITLRALQGLGSSFLFATNMAIVVLTFPAEKSGEALGIMTAGTYTGLSLGPVIGGLLTQYFGWRSIFIVMTIVSLAAFIPAVRDLDWKNEPKHPELDMDMRGTILYMAGLVLSIYGFSNIASGTFGWALLGIGIALLLLFVFAETHTDDPVVTVSIFAHNAIFTLSNITALLNYSAIFTISYLISIYLQVIMGYSSRTAGLILVVQPLMQALLSPRIGKLSDKVAPWKLVTLGMGICVAVLFEFSLLHMESPLWLVILMLACAGVGVAFFSAPNTNMIMSSVGPSDKTFASATLATMRTIGQTTGMAVVTLIAGMYVGNQALETAPKSLLIETVHWCFLVSTALCVAGAVMSISRKKA